MNSRVKVVAEIGVNHNGSLSLAKELIVSAKESGADGVKFQTYRTEAGISLFAPKADYQLERTSTTESQFDMLKRLVRKLDQLVGTRSLLGTIVLDN